MPCSLDRARVSGFGFRVSGFGFRVSGFGLRVPGFGFRISGGVKGVRCGVQRFRGGRQFKAQRLLYHLTLSLRVIKKGRRRRCGVRTMCWRKAPWSLEHEPLSVSIVKMSCSGDTKNCFPRQSLLITRPVWPSAETPCGVLGATRAWSSLSHYPFGGCTHVKR